MTKKENERLLVLETKFENMQEDISEIKKMLSGVLDKLINNSTDIEKHKSKLGIHTKMLFLLLSINSLGMVGVLVYLLSK